MNRAPCELQQGDAVESQAAAAEYDRCAPEPTFKISSRTVLSSAGLNLRCGFT
jgi:hypothetical protein